MTDLLYLRLYDPSCQVAGESAGLLDIGAVNHRALLVTNPEAGTWTVAVYGRINLPTAYTGSFETYVKNELSPATDAPRGLRPAGVRRPPTVARRRTRLRPSGTGAVPGGVPASK